MAEYGLATISVRTPYRRLRPRAADLPRSWNPTQPSPISATHIGKRLAGKLHEPFERAGGGRAISPTSPDSTATKPPNKAGRPAAEAVEQRAEAKENANRCRTCRTQGRESVSQEPERVRTAARPAVKHPRGEPYAGKLHVRIWCSEASCHSSGCKSRQHKESSPCCSYIQRQ